MAEKIDRIGILTSGGDAPGMNSAIRAAALAAMHNGIECVGIRRGFCGLVGSDVYPLTKRDVNNITSRGGTMLYTARCADFYSKKGQKRGAENCRFLGLDGLVVIGGDGSMQGALRLLELGISVVCIPATIDNDIGCTSYSIGFDTACNTAIEAVDKLNDTMQSHERCSIVEVMGHKTGYLALNVGISVSATSTLIPEIRADFENDVIEKIRAGRIAGSTRFTVIVAEGAGNVNEISEKIQKEIGVETRVTTLGHVQRGGSPLVRDRVTAAQFGYCAVELLRSGQSGKVVAMRGEQCEAVDIKEAINTKKAINRDIRAMQEALMS